MRYTDPELAASERALTTKVEAIKRLETRARLHNQRGDEESYWAARQLAQHLRAGLNDMLDRHSELLKRNHQFV